MNPASNETNGINLPPPIGEQSAPQPGSIEAPKATPEHVNTGAEHTQPAPVQTPQFYAPASVASIPQPSHVDVTATTQAVVPNAVDDGDLIEKEWVIKAKQIVESNRDDPFKQSEELTVFKADYLQKRYNKTIKVSK